MVLYKPSSVIARLGRANEDKEGARFILSSPLLLLLSVFLLLLELLIEEFVPREGAIVAKLLRLS